MNSHCTILSDMFSLGMVICTTFNNGRPLIQSNNSTSAYLKQLELLDDAVHNILPRIPVPLQEATSRLVSKAAGPRPTAQLLQLIKYFRWAVDVIVKVKVFLFKFNGFIHLCWTHASICYLFYLCVSGATLNSQQVSLFYFFAFMFSFIGRLHKPAAHPINFHFCYHLAVIQLCTHSNF